MDATERTSKEEDAAIIWRRATEDLQLDVEKSLSLLKAEIFTWEHDSAAGLIQETKTLLATPSTSIDEKSILDKSELAAETPQLIPFPKLDAAFEEMSEMLERMQEEEQQQELCLLDFERMLDELQHIEEAVHSERETFREKTSRNETELETAPIWRSMYQTLKERYYEDLRRHVEETEIRITFESNVPVSFVHPEPCQQPVETVPGIGTRVKAAGNLAEIASSLAAIRFEPSSKGDIRLSIQLKLQNRKVPGLNRFETTSEIL